MPGLRIPALRRVVLDAQAGLNGSFHFDVPRALFEPAHSSWFVGANRESSGNRPLEQVARATPRPGKHELVLFLNGKEAFRHTVTVPDNAEVFDPPAELLRKLQEAEERAKALGD